MLEAPLLFDLTGRGELVVTGKDRASFLHGLITNDVKSLKPGTGCYAAFLTPKGKMLADLTVLCMEDEIVLDCDPALVDKLEGLLRKYLVYSEVVIENRTQQAGVLHVEGTATGDLLRKVMRNAALPERPHGHAGAVLRHGATPGGLSVRLVSESRGGGEGFDLRLPRESLSSVLSLFEATAFFGPPLLSPPSLLEEARILAGIPRWGAELDENVLPDEAGLAEQGAISYTKGCYIGQETVARIKTYGHVNRTLVRLVVEGKAPSPGSGLFFEGEKAGRVTSSTGPGETGRAVALAYVKRERSAPGTHLTVQTPEGDRAAEIAPASIGPATLTP